jgi:hypothetical protein
LRAGTTASTPPENPALQLASGLALCVSREDPRQKDPLAKRR